MSDQKELDALDTLLAEDLVEEARATRARKPYKEATQRPKTLNEALANETNDLFGDFDFGVRPMLGEMFGTVADLNAVKGTNGLKAISLFSGCAGSGTGFALAGWEELMAVEFVKAARETIAANYPSNLVEPGDITKYVRKWLAKNESTLDVQFTKIRNLKQFKHEPIVNWEGTIETASLNFIEAQKLGDEDALVVAKQAVEDLFRLRYDTSVKALTKAHEEGKITLWGDDIRGLDPEAILKVFGLKRGELDCLEGSPPCFPAGTMVVCRDRIRPIEEVQFGHEVLTHKGRWRKVIDTMNRISDTVILDGGRIEATPDHPFYARRASNELSQINSLGEPEWVHADSMEGNYYSVPVDVESAGLPEMPAIYNGTDPELFWTIVGRWLGDGWLRHNDAHDGINVWSPRPKRDRMSTEPRDCANGCGKLTTTHARYSHLYTLFCSRACQVELNITERASSQGYHGGSRGEVLLCSSHSEYDNLWSQLSESGWGWSSWIQDEGTYRYRLANLEFARWLSKHFSHGAASKTIPGWALGMPEEFRAALLRGYLDADGSKTLPDHKEKFTSVSRALSVGMRVLGSTLGYSTSWKTDIFNMGKELATTTIEGRVVNARSQNSVSLVMEEEPRYTRVAYGLRWQKMRGETTEGRTGVRVYDFTVEEDHSFVADGYVVHNCKSFSMSGIREGGWGQVLHYSDERNQRTDDLFIEYVRILKALMPKTFIAENVAGMMMGTAANDVVRPLLAEFDKMGYRVEAKILNSKDYGVPQSRPRVFFVGVRKDLVNSDDGTPATFTWPTPNLHVYRLQDALDAAGQSSEEELKFANIEFGPTGKEYEAGKIWKSLDIGAAPENKAYQLMRCHPNLPVPTITATSAFNAPAAGPTHPFECRKFTVNEMRYLFGFPSDYAFTGDIGQQGERMGRSVTPYVMKQIAAQIAATIHESVPSGAEF